MNQGKLLKIVYIELDNKTCRDQIIRPHADLQIFVLGKETGGGARG